MKQQRKYLSTVVYRWAEIESDYTGNALILKNMEKEKIEGIVCNFNANKSTYWGDFVPLESDVYSDVVVAGDDGFCIVNGECNSYYKLLIVPLHLRI